MENHSNSTNSVTVLHVEDNPGDVLLTEKALLERDTEFRVTLAATGEEALDILQLAADGHIAKPDLILLDLDLPKISGIDLLQFIKEHDSLDSTPVIILTGLVYAESLLRKHIALIQGCFAKPEDSEGYTALAKDIEQVWIRLSNTSSNE